MTNDDRGAYTPPTTDPPLSFDPRRPVRGARPIPITLILSVLVAAVLVAAIFFFYQSGVRQAAQEPVAVGEPVGGIRAAPNEQPPQDPAAGLQIFQADAGEAVGVMPKVPTFTAPPEVPQARPTKPSASVASQLKPAISAPVTPAPLPVTKVAPPPVAKVPLPQPKPAVAARAAAIGAAATGGAARVQVGAVSSTALADRAWSEAVGAAPGLGAGKGKAVEKIEGGTLYRTFVTGFGSRADAQAFCAKLQAAGKGCMVK